MKHVHFLFVLNTDTTAPTITLLEPLPTTTKSPTWTFTWTSSELANFSCAVNTLANPVDCGFGLNGRFTTQPLTDGLHRFYLLGEDAIGNTARVITHRWVVGKDTTSHLYFHRLQVISTLRNFLPACICRRG